MKKSILAAIIIVLILAAAATVFFISKSSYDVQFDTDGGIIYSESVVNCKVGETYKLPTPTKDGYVFLGWYNNPEFTGSTVVEFGIDQIFKSTDLTFYAKFVKLCNISYVVNGFTTDNPTEIRSDETVTLEDPNVIGAIFDGWYLDAEFTKPISKIENPNGDMTLYAKLLKQYGIIYDLAGGTNNPANPEFYASEKGATLFDPLREGYDFMGWVDTEGNPVNNISIGTSGVVNVNATWKPKTYTITWNLNGGKEPKDFDINSYVVGEGVDAEKMMIPTYKNHIFLYWYVLDGDQEIVVDSIDSTSTGDILLNAKWYDNTEIEEKDLWAVKHSTSSGYKKFSEDDYRIEIPEELKKYAEEGRLGINLYVYFKCYAQTEGDATTNSIVYFRINGSGEMICKVEAKGGGYAMLVYELSGPLNQTSNGKEYTLMFEDEEDEILLGYEYLISSNSTNPLVSDFGDFVCEKLSYSYFVLDEAPSVEE